MAKEVKGENVNALHPVKGKLQIGIRKGDTIIFSDGCITKTRNFKHIETPGLKIPIKK